MEFQEYFPEEILFRDGHYFLDLQKVNKNILTAAGIPEQNIHDCGICTCCDHNYFSYRREGETAGRMISLLMIN